jgi:hypothetical protein
LRSETKVVDGEGKPVGPTTVSTVVAVDMPFKVLAETKMAWHLKTIKHAGNRTEITLEVYCPDIPGGLVAHTSKTLDETGKVIERSTLELIDYGIGDGTIQNSSARRRPGLFRRFHSRSR